MGPLAYVVYGVSEVGFSDVKLAFVRGKAGYALERRKLDSPMLALMLAPPPRYDPIFTALLAPGMAWSGGAPDPASLRTVAKRRHMKRRLERARKPWALATGPASVMFLSMKRIGVQMPVDIVLLLQDCRTFNLQCESPKTVK